MKFRVRPSTAWLLGLGLLAAYEFMALEDDDPGDTLSELVWGLSKRRPLVPFAAGVIMGHFFWQKAE